MPASRRRSHRSRGRPRARGDRPGRAGAVAATPWASRPRGVRVQPLPGRAGHHVRRSPPTPCSRQVLGVCPSTPYERISGRDEFGQVAVRRDVEERAVGRRQRQSDLQHALEVVYFVNAQTTDARQGSMGITADTHMYVVTGRCVRDPQVQGGVVAHHGTRHQKQCGLGAQPRRHRDTGSHVHRPQHSAVSHSAQHPTRHPRRLCLRRREQHPTILPALRPPHPLYPQGLRVVASGGRYETRVVTQGCATAMESTQIHDSANGAGSDHVSWWGRGGRGVGWGW